MADRYDAIVVGLGGMGSATAFHLARRGARVLGLERFDVIHPFGSSHGLNRIIRLAYSEHPSYVPLLRRAYELWHELENLDGRQLLWTTGSLEGGLAGGETFTGALRAAELHDLPHEVLTGAEVNGRWPAYRLPEEHRLVHQPDGGFVACEEAVLAHVRQALARGADLRWRVPIEAWEPVGEGVRVRAGGATYEADRLVLAAGAWSSKLVPRLEGLAVPERQILAWLATTRPEVFRLGAMPVFNVEVDEGHYYGFPEWGVPGFKFGRYHHLREEADPDAMDREPERPRRGGPPRVRPPLLPRRRGPHRHAEGVPVHQLTGRALHHRPASRAPAGEHRGGLQRPRLQVLQRRGRDHGGTLPGGSDPPRSAAVRS